MGSTGDPPVPVGDPPTGRARRSLRGGSSSLAPGALPRAASSSPSSPREERVGRGPRRGATNKNAPPLPSPLLHPMEERENRSTRFRQSSAPRLVAAGDAVFPLPEGEGKGEGEPDVANQNGRTNLARSTRLAPRAGGLCYPKINFRLPSENGWRMPPRALVFRAFFPPHPGPLPWGFLLPTIS